jgi:2'-5' RNA ligase
MAIPPPSGAGATALVIPAFPTPPGLASFRRRHIHHAGAAVPFHVTLAAPFLPLAALDDAAWARLRQVAAELAPFDFVADSICCFPTTSVLWLAPSPVSPFEACGEAVYQAFPAVRPAQAWPTYHLTVGLGRSEVDLARTVRAFRAGFEHRLPFRLRARHLDLYVETERGYRRRARWALGGRERAGGWATR